MKFDVEGILKEYLVRTNIKELKRQVWDYKEEKWVTRYDEIELHRGSKKLIISFLGNKAFSISDGKHKHANFYDIQNFHRFDSLESAYQKYYGKTKADFGLSNEQINIVEGVTKLGYALTRKRCENDARMTREIAEKFVENVLNILGEIPRHWNSEASLSEMFVVSHIDEQYLKPFLKYKNENKEFITDVLKFAYNSFKAGIFLSLVKGRVCDVVEVDLVSAYASNIRNLADLVNGEWKEVKSPSQKATFGFYHVSMQFDGYTQLFSPKKSEGILYPKTEEMYENYITAIEYWHFKRKGIRIQFLDGYEFHHTTTPVYPFSEFCDKAFEEKLRAEERGDASARYLWKTLPNGLYGKFCQVHPVLGRLFNPVYASYITAMVRLKILEIAEKYFEEVYEIATDAVFGKLRTDIKIPFSNKLGGFEIKKRYPELIMLQTGLTANDNEQLIRFRGFQKDENSKKQQKIFWQENGIEIFIDRPLHMKECLRGSVITYNNKTITLNASYINYFTGCIFPNVNKRKSGLRKFFSYSDNKRHWLWKYGSLTRTVLTSHMIKSLPLNDEDLKLRGILPWQIGVISAND